MVLKALEKSKRDSHSARRLVQVGVDTFIGHNINALYQSLTPAQCDLYTMDHSVPHITLAKHTSHNWEDLGPFMKSCQRAADWQETSDRSILFSPTLQCYFKSLTSVVHTQRTIQLVPKSTSKPFSSSFLSGEQATAITAFTGGP